jgi:hypothetical protein
MVYKLAVLLFTQELQEVLFHTLIINVSLDVFVFELLVDVGQFVFLLLFVRAPVEVELLIEV